jgi:GNAT superfamily N-acetyltransferase
MEMFREGEIEVLEEMLDDYHGSLHAAGHEAVTFEYYGQVAGLAYFAAAPMTDRAWYLYWILVDRRLHRQGIGGALLQHAEFEIERQGGRILFIETSSLSIYEPTRQFYLGKGYEAVAQVRDYYADDDSLCIFAKRLLARDIRP